MCNCRMTFFDNSGSTVQCLHDLLNRLNYRVVMLQADSAGRQRLPVVSLARRHAFFIDEVSR